MTEDKRTPEQWLRDPEFHHIFIEVRSGWENKEDWNKPITRKEFNDKLMKSEIYWEA